MKNAIKLFAIAILSITFSSCCGVLCTGSIEGVKEVTTYETVRSEGAKGYSEVQVPVINKVKVKQQCVKCGSTFCPKPECCDIISKKVLARATTQGGSGEPHIGLIPTMKTIVPKEGL